MNSRVPKLKNRWCRPTNIAIILAVFDVIALTAFGSYGAVVLARRKDNDRRFDRSISWPIVITICFINVVASFLFLLGIAKKYARLLIGHLALLAARLTTLIVIFILYISWTLRKRKIDNLDIPAGKLASSFWTVASFGFLAAVSFQILYFQMVYKTYSKLKSRLKSVAALNNATIIDDTAGENADFKRIRQPRQSIWKLGGYLGSATEKVTSYPLKPAQYYYKPPAFKEFQLMAMRRASVIVDPRNAVRRNTRDSVVYAHP